MYYVRVDIKLSKCPNCGNEVGEPYRALSNYTFTIELYECNKCLNKFKVVSG